MYIRSKGPLIRSEGPLIRSEYPLIRCEGSLEGHRAQAYKLRSPLPISGRKGIGNMGATITLSRDPEPRQ
jgi:hypothetical protein